MDMHTVAESERPDLRLRVSIRAMSVADAADVLRIYQDGIDTGHATFESSTPDWETWDRGHLSHSRLVALADERLVGWAALSPVSSRRIYRGVAEVSIYLSAGARGLGIGQSLLEALIEASERAGIWTLQAGGFPENAASMRLHQKCGFQVLGVRTRVGKMEHGPWAGRWRDVVIMERRSRIVGSE